MLWKAMGYLFTAAIFRGQSIPRALPAAELAPARTPGSFEAFHVLPENEGWLVRQERDPVPFGQYCTQREAIEAARRLARDGDCRLIIHDENGQRHCELP
jgi:hypothetical protein